MTPAPEDRLGILDPRAVGARFALTRHPPCAALASTITRYWIVSWDLAPGETHVSETLPYPTVNVVFEEAGSAAHGVFTRRFTRTLAGRGRAFGVKLEPGAFEPLLGRPLHTITNAVLPVADVFGDDVRSVDLAIRASEDDAERIAIFERFFLPRLPPPDPDVARVTEIVRVAEADHAVSDVEALAARVALPVRTLQRLFRRYVGVTPKWVLRRFRMQHAADRAARAEHVDWAALAQELGYFDQAHFARDFKAQIGRTPRAYAAHCAATAASRA